MTAHVIVGEPDPADPARECPRCERCALLAFPLTALTPDGVGPCAISPLWACLYCDGGVDPLAVPPEGL